MLGSFIGYLKMKTIFSRTDNTSKEERKSKIAPLKRFTFSFQFP